MLRGGMVPASVDEVLKGHCLLRREQRYNKGSTHYNDRSASVGGI